MKRIPLTVALFWLLAIIVVVCAVLSMTSCASTDIRREAVVLHLASASDVITSRAALHHCRSTCREGNPLLRGSLGSVIAKEEAGNLIAIALASHFHSPTALRVMSYVHIGAAGVNLRFVF